MTIQMDIRTRLAELADEFRRGGSEYALLYETSPEGVSVEIQINFECPFARKIEKIHYGMVFHTVSEVDHWFNRLIKVRPYLVRKIERSC